MFTGIIEELGTVEQLTQGADPTRLRIRSPHVLEGIALGDSMRVSGCCLTVTSVQGEQWSADVISTTLAATSLGDLTAGDTVNLERWCELDGIWTATSCRGTSTGSVKSPAAEGAGGTTLLRLTLPEGLARYVVAKGSLAVDSMSLTVAAIDGDDVTLGLIPETLSRTTLGRREIGDRVNLEVDVLAKYVEKLTAGACPNRRSNSWHCPSTGFSCVLLPAAPAGLVQEAAVRPRTLRSRCLICRARTACSSPMKHRCRSSLLAKKNAPSRPISAAPAKSSGTTTA